MTNASTNRVSTLLSAAVLWTAASGCGVAQEPNPSSPETSLVGEQETSEAALKNPTSAGAPAYVVTLLQSGSFTCTGALVSPQTVLTARHCVTPTTVNVRGVSFGVAGELSHPTADLKLVALKSAVTGVAPVCMNVNAPVKGTRIKAFGCGYPTYGTCNTGSTTIADVQYVQPLWGIPAGAFVKWTSNLTQPELWQGDSGGPIVAPTASGDSLVAINSWSCGRFYRGLPSDVCSAWYNSFSSPISTHVAWIKANAKGGACSTSSAPLP